jgi:hypothetical protein
VVKDCNKIKNISVAIAGIYKHCRKSNILAMGSDGAPKSRIPMLARPTSKLLDWTEVNTSVYAEYFHNECCIFDLRNQRDFPVLFG